MSIFIPNVTSRGKVIFQELNPKNHPVTPDITENLFWLCNKLNVIRKKSGLVMSVTSGLRDRADVERIYLKLGLPPRYGSQHLQGAAADIYDPKKKLWGWVQDNLDYVAWLGLYMEDGDYTPNWVHFQLYPPRSGRRGFRP